MMMRTSGTIPLRKRKRRRTSDMDKANNCKRAVVTRYMCGGMIGCVYFKPEKGRKYNFMRGAHCEHRVYRTDECLSREAKAAADAGWEKMFEFPVPASASEAKTPKGDSKCL
jgi:hypothetical protein